MNLASTIYALRWLVNDTFRQSLASKVFWIMLSVSALTIVFCLSVSIDGGTVVDEGQLFDAKTGRDIVGPNPNPGKMTLLFGAMPVSIHRGGAEEVRLIHLFLAVWVAGAVGLLLTLVWTASFVPEFLQPSSAVVLLSKPVPRWAFLFGKYIGVVLFVALQGMLFFVGTWAALGVKTGIWNNAYLLGWPMLVLQFAVFYSLSLLIAVTWRSTMACVLGILLFWIICFGVNYGRYAMLALPTLAPQEVRPLSPLTRGLMETGYWALPKPADFMMMLEDLLDAEKDKATLSSMPEFRHGRENGLFQPFASMAASLAFGVVMIVLAGRQLNETEY